MGRRLPPLNSLRALEAAARHLSFTKAAEELHVTPAAISHQIKGLEEHLGVPLFRRLNRAVLLTDAGQACLPGLSEAFDRIAAVLERLRAQDRGGPLTVSTSPAFAAKWLVPRLERFQERCPEIEVRVSAAMRLVDFAREDVDVAIRYGPGRYPGLLAERLLTNEGPRVRPGAARGPSPPEGAAGPPPSHAAARGHADERRRLSQLGDVAARRRR